MKSTCLSFALIGCAALFGVTCYAVSACPAAQQTSSTSVAKPTSATPHDSQHVAAPTNHKSQNYTRLHAEQRSLRASVRNHAVSHGSLAGTARAAHTPNGDVRSNAETRVGPDQTVPAQLAGAEKGGLSQMQAANKVPGIRPRGTAIRPSAPSLVSVRHRGANPPAIGGAANSLQTNSARISGTGMHSKP